MCADRESFRHENRRPGVRLAFRPPCVVLRLCLYVLSKGERYPRCLGEQAMIKVRRIRYATFEPPDMDKAVGYYTQVNGLMLAARVKERAFLATEIGELAIELEQGQRARCLGLSFEVAPSADLAAMGRLLSNEGIQSEQRRDGAPRLPTPL